MKSTSTKKRVAVTVGLLIVLAFLYALLAPLMITRVIGSHLGSVYDQQVRIFTPTITALVGQSPQRTVFQCYDSSHSHLSTETTCQNFQIYSYSNVPVSVSAHQHTLDEANKLDALLRKNGWSADRQQDAIKTVAGSVPANPLQNYYVSQVPFHKNIGSISCNLEISFEGTASETAPGAVNVNAFSCQQHFSYFMLHLQTRQFNTV